MTACLVSCLCLAAATFASPDVQQRHRPKKLMDRGFEKTLADYERRGGKVVHLGTDEVPPQGLDAITALRLGISNATRLVDFWR